MITSSQKLFIYVFLAVVLLSVIVGFTYYQARSTMKTASTVSNLGEIKIAIEKYIQAQGHLPENLEQLSLHPMDMIDPFSGQKFIYTPTTSSTNRSRIIVSQANGFRTKLWPFGEIKKLGLSADGEVRDIHVRTY